MRWTSGVCRASQVALYLVLLCLLPICIWVMKSIPYLTLERDIAEETGASQKGFHTRGWKSIQFPVLISMRNHLYFFFSQHYIFPCLNPTVHLMSPTEIVIGSQQQPDVIWLASRDIHCIVQKCLAGVVGFIGGHEWILSSPLFSLSSDFASSFFLLPP